jgi:hypothetical protein
MGNETNNKEPETNKKGNSPFRKPGDGELETAAPSLFL